MKNQISVRINLFEKGRGEKRKKKKRKRIKTETNKKKCRGVLSSYTRQSKSRNRRELDFYSFNNADPLATILPAKRKPTKNRI